MQAVLFDLDGTLLDIDVEAFIGRYYAELARFTRALAPGRLDDDSFGLALERGTLAMMREHPGRTNREVFAEVFGAHTGIDLDAEWPRFEAFYHEVFPALSDTASPAPGARHALETARRLGLRTAVATNPIFPRVAIEYRMSWAGIALEDVDLVTSYELMEACKPDPAYFLQVAELLGVPAHECLMVGDSDVDMAAARSGMLTYYVGPAADVPADHTGDLDELADLLPELL